MTTISRTQISPVAIANTELNELYSSVVKQKYLIKVRLPEKYHETKEAYPVLYLLDGDHAFAMATDIVQYLIYGQHVPDLIIVSPAYGDKSTPEYGGVNMRNRDLAPFPLQWTKAEPGAAAYLDLLEQELIPFIGSAYRVSPSDRTLAGYSLGSFFALYALFQRPGLFGRIIAIDGLDDRLLQMEEAFSASHSVLPVRLFVSSGEDDMSKMAVQMEKRGYAGLAVEHAQLNGLGHFAVGAEGLTKGLVSVFLGWAETEK